MLFSIVDVVLFGNFVKRDFSALLLTGGIGGCSYPGDIYTGEQTSADTIHEGCEFVAS